MGTGWQKQAAPHLLFFYTKMIFFFFIKKIIIHFFFFFLLFYFFGVRLFFLVSLAEMAFLFCFPFLDFSNLLLPPHTKTDALLDCQFFLMLFFLINGLVNSNVRAREFFFLIYGFDLHLFDRVDPKPN